MKKEDKEKVMKRIPNECPMCGCKVLLVEKTYQGNKAYINGKPEHNTNSKFLIETNLFCSKCNWNKYEFGANE